MLEEAIKIFYKKAELWTWPGEKAQEVLDEAYSEGVANGFIYAAEILEELLREEKEK